MDSSNEFPDNFIEENQQEAERNFNDKLDESAADKLQIVDNTLDTSIENNLNSSHEEKGEEIEEANVEGTNQDQVGTNEEEMQVVHSVTEHQEDENNEQHPNNGDIENEGAQKDEAAPDHHYDEHENSDKEDETSEDFQTIEEPANHSIAPMAEIASDPEEELDEDIAEQPGTSNASAKPTRRILIDSDDEENADCELYEDGGEQAAEDQQDEEEEQKEKGSGDENEKETTKKVADVSELMQNIFGDDMSDDEEQEGNEVI